MKGFLQFLVANIILLALASSFVSCSNPSPQQDFCVAVEDGNGVYVSGAVCKDPRLVTSDDFYSSRLNTPGNTSNRVGSFITPADIPGSNTLGVGLARIDIARGGQVPPHTHPRASEILLVVKGKILTGFVSSNDYNNTLYSKVLYPGDAYVHPMGLIQFHANIGKTNAIVIGAAGSDNPGFIAVADAIFGSKPLISPKILAKAFATDLREIKRIQEVISNDDDIVNSAND